MSGEPECDIHAAIFVHFAESGARLQSTQQGSTLIGSQQWGDRMKKYALGFGLLFLVIGGAYLLLSGDLGGAFLLGALGIGMSTMALVVIHAMTTEG